MSCSYNSDTELHPFAFRTHTHAMGRVVSAYVKKAPDGKWSQIGKRNPQWPQVSAEVKNSWKQCLFLAVPTQRIGPGHQEG